MDNYSAGNLPLLDNNEFIIKCQEYYYASACINLAGEFDDISYTINHVNGPPIYDVYLYGGSIAADLSGDIFADYPATYKVCATVELEDCTQTICQDITIVLDDESCFDLLEEDQIDTRSSNEKTDIKTLEVYPNPNNGEFTISNEQNGEVYILDITGKVVHSQVASTANQTLYMDITPGLYFVKFMASDGTEYEVSKVSIH